MGKCIRTCLGENIKRLRGERGYTQKDFAKRAKLSISFLQNVECGKRWISPEKIALLAGSLGVSESELFHDCESFPAQDPRATLLVIAQALGVHLSAEHLASAALRSSRG